MTNLAIQVHKLGKQYHIGAAQEQTDRLAERLTGALAAPFRRAGKILRGNAGGAAELDETIWALRGVSFDVQHGDVVGIIGRNGAGKSTLLKILSRITDPTAGEAFIYGRVGSLLEVGTGFHPELTGRENIFLNGAILGMKKAEIARRFDEIVAFAELDKFIDTPVKHYSSGMYVRLAFSVAAHLEPEILLVDEVLAVGDVAFQRKCLGKMDDVAQEGRTVLFVSHNMSLMQSLCRRGIFLHDGAIAYDGPVDDAVDAYLASIESAQAVPLAQRTDRSGRGRARITNIHIENPDSGQIGILQTGQAARFTFKVDDRLPATTIAYSIYDHLGQPIAHFKSKPRVAGDTAVQAVQGTASYSVAADGNSGEAANRYICEMDPLLLLPGRYRINASLLGDNVLQDFIEGAAFFDVSDGYVDGRAALSDKKNRTRVHLPHRWVLPKESANK